MATYRELVGKKIKKVTSDPSDSLDGQMWYNSTTGKIRGLAITEAWASGSPLLSINYGAGGAGTQTAMLYFGGANYTGSPPYPGSITNATYEYNGTGWSTGGDYTGSVVYVSGCGTQTAGLAMGGYTGTATLTASAEYDGSTWTAGNSMSQKRQNAGTNMVGTQPAALITGGDQYPSTPRSLSTCEEYDGTNWTSGGGYPVVIQNTAQAGTQTAGWAAGGLSDPAPAVSNIARDATNHYDGSSWSAGGTLPAVNYRAGAAGTQTAGLTFGGYPNTTNTFAYDGTTWTAKPALALARNNIGSGGVSSTTTAAIGAGGYDPGPGSTSATEEFTASTNVITAAAWASGANIGTTRNNLSGCGTQTASLIAGGDNTDPSYLAVVEEYNGTSWSEQNDLPANRRSGAMAGTQTAAIYFGGQSYPNNESDGSYKYDGSSWTSGGAMPVSNAFAGVAGTGTQTAALGVGGYIDPPGAYTNLALEYDGSSWSANPNNYPAAVTAIGHCGTQTAALLSGGATSPGAFQSTSFTYDGSSFSAAPSLIFAHSVAAAGGTQTDAIICTGQTTPQPTASSQAQGYDGTSWSSRPGVSSVRRYSGSGKSTSPASASWVAGGYTGSAPTNAHEEFTGETTAANVETFSTS